MDETGDAAVSVKDGDCDDDEIDTTHIHTDVSMTKSDFNELIKNIGNNLENE